MGSPMTMTPCLTVSMAATCCIFSTSQSVAWRLCSAQRSYKSKWIFLQRFQVIWERYLKNFYIFFEIRFINDNVP